MKTGAWFHDMVGSGSDEHIELWLRYHADQATRENWAKSFPDTVIPPSEKPVADRDWRLPKAPPPFAWLGDDAKRWTGQISANTPQLFSRVFAKNAYYERVMCHVLLNAWQAVWSGIVFYDGKSILPAGGGRRMIAVPLELLWKW